MPEPKIYYYISCTPPSGNYPGQCERRRSDIILLGFYGGTRGVIGNFIATARHCCCSTRRNLSDFWLAKKHAPTTHTHPLSGILCGFVWRFVCRIICRCVRRLSADVSADLSADVSADSFCRSANLICRCVCRFSCRFCERLESAFS